MLGEEKMSGKKATWEEVWKNTRTYEDLYPSPIEIEKEVWKNKPVDDEDIVYRLRDTAKALREAIGEDSGTLLLDEAADEIEHLRAALEKQSK